MAATTKCTNELIYPWAVCQPDGSTVDWYATREQAESATDEYPAYGHLAVRFTGECHHPIDECVVAVRNYRCGLCWHVGESCELVSA